MLISLLLIIILLACSALVSSAEVAYFSLSTTDMQELENNKGRTSKLALQLLELPKKLLATILIANNFVNVSIIILSTFLTKNLIDAEAYPFLFGFVELVVVTFLLLLIGEVIPKVYATKYALKTTTLMAYPLKTLRGVFSPLSSLLISSTSFIDKRIKKKNTGISADDLSNALELTAADATLNDEQKLLKGVVKFGRTSVRQVMTPRTNVKAFADNLGFKEILEKATSLGFSRIPIYKESLDHVHGVLYLKDLLPYLDQQNDFKWLTLLRKPFFVPENKMINSLLQEFQEKKIHLAVVVDEYGGTSGVVSLEDVIEEIVGEIIDENDDDEIIYSKLDDQNFIFEGKTALNDIYRILDIDDEEFEKSKGESDSIAGFIIELHGKIPKKNERINFNDYTFTIESADKKRINRIKVTIKKTSNNNPELSKSK
ncbi:MAG: gliding motility-associated protein GldE [Flavobacteriales bacterium]|nr:gliding motility-associated protein GldE [Flavobacteriales bacterium]